MNAVSSFDAATVLAPLVQQLHQFFHHLDERRYDAMLALFTEDCRWFRQGQWLEGQAAVRGALEARPLGSETRHVMTNSHVREFSQERVVLESYMTAYRYPTPMYEGNLPLVSSPLRLNQTTTVFRRDAGYDWRIAEQQLIAIFTFSQ